VSAITTVGICGFGTIGAGAAELCSRSGYVTYVLGRSENHLSGGLARVEASTARAEQRGKITREEVHGLLGRIHGTVNIEELRECDIVIEAATEDFKVKKRLLQDLDAICNPEAVFASTTSSLSISDLASVTERPSQVVGMHLFNPVPVMKLLEIGRGEETSQSVIETVRAFAESLGKVALVLEDSTGSLVNRLLFPYLLHAVRLLESGVADKHEIDLAMELGCNMPVGPLKLIDLIGVDLTDTIAHNLHQSYQDDRFDPPTLLGKLLAEGRPGRKARKGFYDY